MSDYTQVHKINIAGFQGTRQKADLRAGGAIPVASEVIVYRLDPETGERVEVRRQAPYTSKQVSQMLSDAVNPRNSRRTGKNKRLGEKGK